MLFLRSDGTEFIPKPSEMGLREQREFCVCSEEKVLIKAFDTKIYILCLRPFKIFLIHLLFHLEAKQICR